ncbi:MULTISPECIES: glutamate formimidoyltransferase [unclassified Mucilaginibacter]|uniref:glutamate formimidoyltransferase n=1 Tax=unclassified Mucilaginibacter TaxID=2617802 RepID=UPI002AC9474D|nr:MULTISPECIES: glutamate formimidoyltransferase [unclassified Mucilaginibacter]MEB0262441.1 glutamate formimidoyltransferase [Mucilaginibacter sp. 10I4]MEB0279266.1 glutamate formimidoyltransferase [Mucilaginibacter sp. 10B2]MEB0300634.1 glutamate formimidoyltransferase [Mucilaginibacter sp. 5C4]WPX23222.1 glutamate formimidoyltransferase [Mucilaginibacter sp. 5C4]
MNQLIECVPNFSEGVNLLIIKQITDEVETVEGVRLLNVDPGKATNRTVVTFVGEPKQVIEAAFLAIKKAGELIDMSKHKGEHPRMGATDVCPLIPIANISMDETAEYAKQLAKRVGEELGIPAYLYQHAQADKTRDNLSVIRAGEYESFFKKIKEPKWKPDFGPAEMDAKRGATVIGARDFLIAYNINLNTTSTRRANAIAFDVREAGRVMREGDPVNGKIINDENDKPKSIPGTLKSVKAIGWYIEEYGVAQISMNLTNIELTPIHVAFDEVCKRAAERGIRVTGSELVGLIPLKAMLDAGKYFLKKQQRSVGVSEAEIIKIAIKSMGLDELGPFNPDERIVEYLLRDASAGKLVGMTLTAFADETASESPAPGGGSISAYMGALGVSLATMVANLSSHKKGWDNRWEEFSNWAEQGQALKDELLRLVDVDTTAFNKIMEAFSLPKGNEQEKATRDQAIQDATKYAIDIPFKVMETAYESLTLIRAMVESGNPNSVTDAGVAALCVRSAVMGAFMNVKINASGYKDKAFVDDVLKRGEAIEQKTIAAEAEIIALVNEKIE